MAEKSYKIVVLGMLCILLARYAAAEDESLFCIPAPLAGLLRPVLNVFGIATTTTTTTSSTTSTTTSTTTTDTSTTYTTTTTSSTRYTTSTTTTTLSQGGCNSYLDCPAKITKIKCTGNDKNTITEETTTFVCTSAGTPESQCKGTINSHTIKLCYGRYSCENDNPECLTEKP